MKTYTAARRTGSREQTITVRAEDRAAALVALATIAAQYHQADVRTVRNSRVLHRARDHSFYLQ